MEEIISEIAQQVEDNDGVLASDTSITFSGQSPVCWNSVNIDRVVISYSSFKYQNSRV